MDWANERYVRWYTRDTKTWLLLGWEGQCVLGLTMRKVDRAGVLDDVSDAADLAVIFANGMPVDVIQTGLNRLVKLNVVELTGSGLILPNYIEAQEAAQSDAQRARESRERKRSRSRIVTGITPSTDEQSQNVTPESQAVTARHAQSQPVTPSVPSLPSTPTNAVPFILVEPSQPKRKKSATVPMLMTDDWQPTDRTFEAISARFGIGRQEITALVPEFRMYWIEGAGAGKRTGAPHWQTTFVRRVEQLSKFGNLCPRASGLPVKSNGYHRPPPQPNEPDMRDRYVPRQLGETDEQLEARRAEVKAGIRGPFDPI